MSNNRCCKRACQILGYNCKIMYLHVKLLQINIDLYQYIMQTDNRIRLVNVLKTEISFYLKKSNRKIHVDIESK